MPEEHRNYFKVTGLPLSGKRLFPAHVFIPIYMPISLMGFTQRVLRSCHQFMVPYGMGTKLPLLRLVQT